MPASNTAVEHATIRQYCKTLRTPMIASQFPTLAEQATREKQSYTRYLEALLAMEVEERERHTIARRIQDARLEQTEFVRGVTDESLKRVITYVNARGETWQYSLEHMMQHLVNHSSYHRGQIALMLRQLGTKAFPTDFLVFFDLGGQVE